MAGWGGLTLASPPLQDWLRAIGAADSHSLAYLFTDAELTDGTAASLLASAIPVSDAETGIALREQLAAVVSSARRWEALRDCHLSQVPLWVAAARGDKRRRLQEWQREEDRYHIIGREALRSSPPPPPEVPRYGAATRRARLHDGDPHGRENAERDERSRWMKVLAGLIQESGVSVLNQAWDGLSLDGLVELLVGGRRASTLRSRARAWRRFQSYLLLSIGAKHPRHAFDEVAYLRVRAAEPCSQSVLRNLKALFVFIDHMTGLKPPLSSDPLLQSAFKEYLSQAPARRAGDAKPAPRIPASILAAMEDLVVNEEANAFDRMVCWWMALSCWCTLRFDDHRGVIPGEFWATGNGWNFDLRRSKTTGPGKRAALRPCHLAEQAYLSSPDWFAVGRRVWDEAAPFGRDFMLCAPASGLGEAIHREISHDEFTARMRGAIARLGIGGIVLGERVASWYTPHSGRNFLPSAALPILRATEEDLRKLGAWSTKEGGAYVRTVRDHTRHLQVGVAQGLRERREERDPLREQDDLVALGRHLIARGMSSAEVKEIVDVLAWTPHSDKGQSVTATASGSDSGGGTSVAGRAELSRGEATSARGARASSSHEHGTSGSAAPSVDGVGGSSGGHGIVDDEPVTGYVCSVLGKRRVRRLHYVGLCYRRPGWDYAEYERHGDVAPAATAYDLVCRQCWPDGRPEEQGEGSSVASTDESSSTEAED